MPQHWQFEQDEHQQWRWKKHDEDQGSADSVETFSSVTACMLDAVRYAVERRRANPYAGRTDLQ